MTGFPPPTTRPLVQVPDDPDLVGWLYRDEEIPLGGRERSRWTAHLTNALHDAGFFVARRRRREERT